MSNHIKLLPFGASDADLIAVADSWAAHMESEDYAVAFAFTQQNADGHWTPELLREVVKAYGAADPNQKVTLDGKPTDIAQRKEVDRWERNAQGEIGEIWYDLNIDGLVSDLTATFAIIERSDGIVLELNDIHVM